MPAPSNLPLVNSPGAADSTLRHAGDRPLPTSSVQKRLVVVVPAFNEAKSITQTISNLRGLRERLNDIGVKLSIYVVDDGSTDETSRLAADAGVERVLRHRINQGLGAAVRTGLSAARDDGFDILVKFDADLQHDPADLLQLVSPILADEADIVYGNRFDRIEYKMPFLRRIGNFAFSRLMKWLTGWPLKDSQPGIFAVDKDYLSVAFIPGDYNYTQQILLDAYHKRMRFAHVPVAFRKRTTGKSFVSLKYPFKVLPQIVMVTASIKPMKIFVPIGTAFVLFGSAIFLFQFVSWLAGHGSKPVENVNLVLGSILFGVQTVFFGVLAQLIVQMRK